MSRFQKTFIAVDEKYPAEKFLKFFRQSHEAYRAWFLKEGDLNRPGLMDCQKALHAYMPELLPFWQHLIQLTNADEISARMLSGYCPTPTSSGCSQAVWTRYNPVWFVTMITIQRIPKAAY